MNITMSFMPDPTPANQLTAPLEGRAVLGVVVQCGEHLAELGAAVALAQNGLGESVLCIHNCDQQQRAMAAYLG